MSLRKLTATILSAAAAASTALTTSAAQAQIYGYSNGWRQPIHNRQTMRPSYSDTIYRNNYPVMQQPNFGPSRRMSNIGGFGHSNGNHFGW
jgi:hypothetical protein